MPKPRSQRKPESVMARKALAAMQDAIDKVIEDHRRRRMPLAIWRDGKVVFIQPEEALLARERRALSRTRPRGKRS